MNNSRSNILRIQKDISNLMQQGKSSQEIMSLLHIPLRSYRRYSKAIFIQDKDIWHDIVKDELCTQLLRLRNSYEETHLAAKELSTKPGLQTTDVLMALAAKDQALLDILKLMVEGTELLSKQPQVKYHRSQKNILLQLQPHP